MRTEPDRIAEYFHALWNQDWLVFPKKHEPLYATTRKGVYVIADQQKIVLHVGATPRAAHGIEKRLKDHLGGKSSFARSYLRPRKQNLRNGSLYCYKPIKSSRVMALVEAYAISRLCPKHLGTHQRAT